jgi:hypothetical protein
VTTGQPNKRLLLSRKASGSRASLAVTTLAAQQNRRDVRQGSNLREAYFLEKPRVSVSRLLSAGAVVVSLTFVGYEIQQNTSAQRAQTRQALADASREWIIALATNPDLDRAYEALWRPDRAGVEAGTQLTPADSSVARVARRIGPRAASGGEVTENRTNPKTNPNGFAALSASPLSWLS